MAKRKGPARSVERERFWRECVRGWQQSGCSVRAWCSQQQVSEPSFYAWRRELARRGAARADRRKPSRLFLPVTIAAEPTQPADRSPAPLRIDLPGAVSLHVQRGCEPALLAAALNTLHAGRDGMPEPGEDRPC